MNSKTCSKCTTQKPLSAFGNCKRGKDGKRPHCKDCRKIESKAGRSRENERRSQRWHTDPVYRGKQSERHKRYNPKANERMKANASSYSDTYVIAAIKRGTDLKTEDIRQQPDLIAAWRETMRVRKLIRTENEKRKRVKRKANSAVPEGRGEGYPAGGCQNPQQHSADRAAVGKG